MQIQCLKLVSGEEIIANISSENEKIKVSKPMMLVMAGEGQLMLVPWLPLAEKSEVTIEKNNVLFSYIPKVDLENHYRQIIGGIVTAPAGALNRLDKPF